MKHNKITISFLKRYSLAVVALGLLLQGVSVSVVRGHNLVLLSGFILVLVGVFLWVKNKKDVKKA